MTGKPQLLRTENGMNFHIFLGSVQLRAASQDIVPEIIESGLCITELFQNKSVAYFDPKQNTFFHLYAMKLFSADATIFKRIFKKKWP